MTEWILSRRELLKVVVMLGTASLGFAGCGVPMIRTPDTPVEPITTPNHSVDLEPPRAIFSENPQHNEDIFAVTREFLNHDYRINRSHYLKDRAVLFDPTLNETWAVVIVSDRPLVTPLSPELGPSPVPPDSQPFSIRNSYQEGKVVESSIAPHDFGVPIINYDLIPGRPYIRDFEKTPENLVGLARSIFNIPELDIESAEHFQNVPGIRNRFVAGEVVDVKGRRLRLYISTTLEVSHSDYNILLDRPPFIELDIRYS